MIIDFLFQSSSKVPSLELIQVPRQLTPSHLGLPRPGTRFSRQIRFKSPQSLPKPPGPPPSKQKQTSVHVIDPISYQVTSVTHTPASIDSQTVIGNGYNPKIIKNMELENHSASSISRPDLSAFLEHKTPLFTNTEDQFKLFQEYQHRSIASDSQNVILHSNGLYPLGKRFV